MELTEEQKSVVRGWAGEGRTLSQIQAALRNELGISLSYMDTRLLVGDLEIALAEKAAPAAPSPTISAPAAAPEAAGPGGKVSVTLDELIPPHAVISGKVTFTDGTRADWYFDDLGRLALNPTQPGYRPTEADLLDFQRELRELVKTRGL